MPLTALIGLVNTIATIALALFAFFKNPLAKTNRAYLFFGLSVGLYSIGYFFWGMSKTPVNALFAFKVLTTGIIFINSGFLEFAFYLLGLRQKKKTVLHVIHLLNCLFTVAVWSELLFSSVGRKNVWGYWPYPHPLFYAYFLFWIFQMGYGLAALRTGYLQAPSRQAVQLRYVFYSTLIGYIGGGTNWLPWFGINFPPYLNALVTVYVAILAYAIVRYRLMDIQTAVTRTGIFIFVYCIVLGIPAALVLQGRPILENLLGAKWWLLPGGLYAVLSFVGPFIYLILQRKAEAVLLKEQKAYQQTLLQASRGMTLIKDLNHLLKLIVHILTKTVRITHARIFLWDNNAKNYVCKAIRGDHRRGIDEVIPENAALIQQLHAAKEPLMLEEIRSHNSTSDAVIAEMDALEAAVVVPSFVQERLIGFVVLGNKKSNRLYTESDLDILTTLANQAALAIENCIFLTEFEHQQAHFFQTAKMADLGTMASGIGHQVNNRFNVIKLGAESALMVELRKLMKSADTNDPEAIKKIASALTDTCQKIAKSAEHGGEIVRRLLDFSRLAEGFVLMDVKEAIESSVRLWECKHDLREINFHTKIEPDLVKIKGNFSEIEEVLFNMLDNAADAIKMKEEAFRFGNLPKSPDWEKGSIWLKAENSELDGKPHVLITVSENGIGMDEETQKRIFVPFFTTKATAIKGTGLGLYIIRRMVDAHQGRIKIESEHGKGTTFYIYLPAASGG
jgi:signal transduction histidine kinase